MEHIAGKQTKGAPRPLLNVVLREGIDGEGVQLCPKCARALLDVPALARLRERWAFLIAKHEET